MKTLKKVLVFLFAPSGFKIGLVITTSMIYLGHVFYATPPELIDENPILKVLSDTHNKTVDFRIVQRGEKEVSKDIALVVVDETSLEKLGRWPWPRTKIADMIERLRSYDAKVIAFDAVFAEPEVNPAMRTLISIKNSGLTNPDLDKIIDREFDSSNSDLKLSQTIVKHADHLVMGAYFDYREDRYYPFQEVCGAIIESKTAEHAFLENEAIPVVPLDEKSVDVPEELNSKLVAYLEKIESDIKETSPAPATQEEKINLQSNLRKGLQDYCDRWLIEGKDENLTQLRAPASELNIEQFMYSVMKNEVLRTGRWWLNVPALAQGTKHTGFFNAFPDGDGTMRITNLLVRYGNTYIPSLALKSIMLYKNLGALVTLDVDPINPTAKGVKSLALTDPETAEVVETLPVDTQGRLMINYAGPTYKFPHISVSELFNDKDTAKIKTLVNGRTEEVEVNKSEWLKDKIFLFGATAKGIYDLRVTPFEENFPGPEIHTNIMDNLLRKDFLTKPANEAPYMLASMGVAGIALSALITYVGAVVGLLITVLALFGVTLYDKYYVFGNGMVVTIVLPLTLIGALYIVLTFYKYLTEERKKKELKGTFAKYVSPQVVNEILKDPDNVQLGGKKVRMSVMFSDVRGFTTISEKLEPTKLGDILNLYLTPMTRLVFEHKGTLDKYMGDAIMAFWGAPIHFPDHAVHACKCALHMMKQLDSLNQKFAQEGLPAIDIGIGINTGDMSVGNMGSDIVRSYTVMGDSVNLGSRLEGINKEYGTHIIISEFTYQDVKDHFVCREVDWVRVKGKNEPVKIYELISENNDDAKLKQLLTDFNQGFNYYHEKKWDEAIAHFSKSLEINPEDYASKLYIKRCTNFKQNPPPDVWDGVYEMKTK